MKTYSFGLWILCLLCKRISFIDGACDFPSALQDSTWQSSDWGSVTFNSSHFQVEKIGSFGARTFECDTLTGSNYFSISDEFRFLSSQFKLSVCMQLSQQSDDMFIYYLMSPILSNTVKERTIFKGTSASHTYADTCSLTTTSESQLRILVRDGFDNTTATTCPNVILGTYEYVVPGSSCSRTWLDSCTNNTTPTFNYTLCSTQTMMYSSGGELNCVYSSTNSNDTTYVWLYNLDTTTDNSATYRYTCIVVEQGTDNITVSQYPEVCLETQNTTAVDSPGLLYTLIANTTCPVVVTSSDDSTEVLSAGAIIAVGLAILLLILAGVIIGIWYYCKVYRVKKVSPTVTKDVEALPPKTPPASTIDPTGGLVSPFSPYPTASELATYRFGPDQIDDDDGGITLGATTPGFTDGRRTQFEPMTPFDQDQGSRASLPVYSEVGGDTPEPTRMSEMRGSLTDQTRPVTQGEPTPFPMNRESVKIPEEDTVSAMTNHRVTSISSPVSQAEIVAKFGPTPPQNGGIHSPVQNQNEVLAQNIQPPVEGGTEFTDGNSSSFQTRNTQPSVEIRDEVIPIEVTDL